MKTLVFCTTLVLGCALVAPAQEKAAAPKAAMKSTVAPAATKMGAAKSTAAKGPAPAARPNPALLKPELLKAKAPDVFKAKFVTPKGEFVVEVTRAWSPLGADRFYNLVKNGFFTNAAFFRVISGFMVQFGLSAWPEVNRAWREVRIQDDPVKESNKRGMLSFAMGGPNTRTSQVFINFGDNSRLDGMAFSPFGKVLDSGMEVVDKLYAGYGEGAPNGKGPDQGMLQSMGEALIKRDFPEMDHIISATIVAAPAPAKPAAPAPAKPAAPAGAKPAAPAGAKPAAPSAAKPATAAPKPAAVKPPAPAKQ